MLSANFEFLSRNWRFSTILQLSVQPLQSVAPQLGGPRGGGGGICEASRSLLGNLSAYTPSSHALRMPRPSFPGEVCNRHRFKGQIHLKSQSWFSITLPPSVPLSFSPFLFFLSLSLAFLLLLLLPVHLPKIRQLTTKDIDLLKRKHKCREHFILACL